MASTTESSNDTDSEYVFGMSEQLIYRVSDEIYRDPGYRGALEENMDLVIDTVQEEGYHNSNLSDSEIDEAINEAQEEYWRNKLDVDSADFQKKSEDEWQDIIDNVWKNLFDTSNLDKDIRDATVKR